MWLFVICYFVVGLVCAAYIFRRYGSDVADLLSILAFVPLIWPMLLYFEVIE